MLCKQAKEELQTPLQFLMECVNRCANHILWLQVPGNRQGVTLDARELTSRFTKPPSKPKEINHEMCLRVVLRLLLDWHGLREDEGVFGNEPRGISGAEHA